MEIMIVMGIGKALVTAAGLLAVGGVTVWLGRIVYNRNFK